ncbi:App1 family protein [Tessaracoccus sp. OH4464_COT-324]|uniref:App1 family protein n=1 Tax=Tessaracoccus sp. OH4464_COT-324 TaxID=2491059 RepID=UPI000F644695|nr:phosphatase domain-containing protein [Tessaracoccus sp. OH4464_COT-324]RRD47408.1 DUF2183 domain-containing protein [Tessaracoccus sp. OH4464_COT-324]
MRNRPFIGARLEDHIKRMINRVLIRRGWQEAILPYIGYGTREQLRVMSRVLLAPADGDPLARAAGAALYRRGWRNFIAVSRMDAAVTLTIGNARVPVAADRGGYIDVRIKNPGLPPGWHDITITSAGGVSAVAPVQVIDDDVRFGIVSDIDDTILSTWLPRPMLAAWNSLILTEQARQAVPGMARWFQQLLAAHPGAPIIYVSTGAYNTFPMIRRFQGRHGFPTGAMLLTDWGPTNTGWFRSGPDHKRTALRELARDLPNVRWLLIGDDGQHDPQLYAEFAELQPDHVLARGIRELTPGELVLAHGIRLDGGELRWNPKQTPEFRAPDGDGLADRLRRLAIIDF